MDKALPSSPIIDLHVDDARCESCGYDLRGAVRYRCPECGEGFTPFELQLHNEIRKTVRRHVTGPNIFHMWAITNWVIFIGLIVDFFAE